MRLNVTLKFALKICWFMSFASCVTLDKSLRTYVFVLWNGYCTPAAQSFHEYYVKACCMARFLNFLTMIHSNKCILHCDKHRRIGSQKFHGTVHIFLTKCDTLIFYILIHLVRCPLLAIKLIVTLWVVTQYLKNTALSRGVLYLGRCSFSYTEYLFQMPQVSTSLYLY